MCSGVPLVQIASEPSAQTLIVVSAPVVSRKDHIIRTEVLQSERLMTDPVFQLSVTTLVVPKVESAANPPTKVKTLKQCHVISLFSLQVVSGNGWAVCYADRRGARLRIFQLFLYLNC